MLALSVIAHYVENILLHLKLIESVLMSLGITLKHGWFIKDFS